MRIALIGCGRIAVDHAKLVRKHIPTAELVFCDRNPDKAEKYASSFSGNSKAYSVFESMLESEAPDSVHVLTHPSSHFSLAAASLEGDAHVYIEKPITESLADLEKLQAIAENRNRVLYSGYSALGHPVVQRASRIINSGSMGELISAHCDFNVSPPVGQIPYGNPDHWAYFLEGGILQNVIDHPLSVLASVLGKAEIHDVCVLTRADLPQNSPNLMHAIVKNEKQLGSFTLSYGNGNSSASVAYVLEAGTITVDLRSSILTTQYGAGPQTFMRRFRSGVSATTAFGLGTIGMVASRLMGQRSINSGIDGLISNFYSVIRGEALPIVSHETARTVVGQLEGIWQQAGIERRKLTNEG